MKTLEHIRKKQDSLHFYHKVPILPEDMEVRCLVSNTQCPNCGKWDVKSDLHHSVESQKVQGAKNLYNFIKRNTFFFTYGAMKLQ